VFVVHSLRDPAVIETNAMSSTTNDDVQSVAVEMVPSGGCCLPRKSLKGAKRAKGNLRGERAELRARMSKAKNRMSVLLGTEFHEERGYRWDLSTMSNYTCSEAHEDYGKHTDLFESIRRTLDHEYHGHYTLERQQVQDGLIDDLLSGVVEVDGGAEEKPWITFTAGAMGAGKSRTMEWLSAHGIFPLSRIVQVDPDLFKTSLPEWDEYVRRNALGAGYHTRKETGMLCEIAQEAGMRRGLHLWVDGSLRDAEWYGSVFQHIKRTYPQYRIAIIHVVADSAIVYDRARRRGNATGRHVPDSEIQDSIDRVPKAVERLAPLASFVATIDNSSDEPRLIGWKDRSRTTASLKRIFTRTSFWSSSGDRSSTNRPAGTGFDALRNVPSSQPSTKAGWNELCSHYNFGAHARKH
jgi:predicted ABC-type ATPase